MFYKRINTSGGIDKKMVLKVELLPGVFTKVCEALRPSFSDDVTPEDLKASISLYLTFDIASYANLCSGNASYWDEHVGFTDKIFRKLSEDECAVFAIMLIQNHQLIKSVMANLENEEDQTVALSTLCQAVSDSIIFLDQLMNLFEKIKEVSYDLKIPNNPLLGTREQDNEDLTFYPEHVRAVMMMIITTKIFMPLFSAMLAESKSTSIVQKKLKESFGKIIKVKTKIIDNKTKEIYCLAFIEKLFYLHIPEYYEKFLNYLDYFTQKYKKKTSASIASSVFRNITAVELTKMVEASVICKRCVNIGLYTQGENVMGILKGAVKTTVDSIEKDTKNNDYFIRQLQSGNDDATTNESQLEANSMKSKEPDQVSSWIRLMYEKAVLKFLKLYEIPDTLLKNVVLHNIRNNPPIEDFIPALLSSVFYEEFESAQSILMLEYEPFITLVSLTQIICAKQGMFGLAHRLTAQRVRYADGNFELKEKGVSDTILISNALSDARGILDNMQRCKTRITSQDKSRTLVKEVRRWIFDLAHFFTTYNSYYKTAPELCELMGDDPTYNGPFELQPDLLKCFCTILERKSS